MQKAHFSFTSGRNVNSNRPLALIAALLMTILLGLFPAGTSQAQQNDGTFVIDDIIVEESDTSSVNVQEVALDEGKNRYVFGNFNGTVEFGEGGNSQELQGTDSDLFVAKYDTNNNLLWIQEFETSIRGSLPGATPAGIEFDDIFGHLYVAGSFIGGLDIGTEQLTAGNSTDGFLAQLNPETGDVQWVNQIIGTQTIFVNDISANGNIALTGEFKGVAEFPGQFETQETLLSLTPGGEDMFAVRYDFAGQTNYAIQAGGNGAEGQGIYMNDGNSFTVVGDFSGTIRFRDSNGREPAELTSQDGNDGFIVRYNRSGQLRFVTHIAGPATDSAVHVVEKKLNIYVAGTFFEQTTIGSTTLTSRGQNDTFVARVSSITGEVQRVTQIASDDTDFLRGLDADNEARTDGSIFISGNFSGPQLTIGEGSTAIHLDESETAIDTSYLTEISVDGGVFIPSFGQTVQGQFKANRITVAEDSTNLQLAGNYRSAVAFGEGNQTIELPAPSGSQAMAVAQFVPNNGNNEPDALYVSSTTGGIVDGITFRDEDVLRFSIPRQTWAMLIDGSDIGLGPTDINAVHQQTDGSILLSVNSTLTLPDIGEIDDSDILRFVPETLGRDTTGTLELFLRGADVGLTTNDEDIDAIAIDTDGRLVISTLGNATVPGTNGELSVGDEDLLVRNGNVWELLFDGSDVGLTDNSEDISAASIDAESVTLSTEGAYAIDSLTGNADDVFNCKTLSTGDNTQIEECTIVLDGSANRLTGEVVDAFSLAQP